ncbi:MAG: hypothetical protein JXA30_10270 [Deltaproteobacteria bacterium]|nr:hypothetical protein [Deltaproteobacteria bacterium]
MTMDRACNDYELFGGWTEQGIIFATRLKENSVYVVIENREVLQNRNIISDTVIRLVGTKAEQKCPQHLRRIVI